MSSKFFIHGILFFWIFFACLEVTQTIFQEQIETTPHTTLFEYKNEKVSTFGVVIKLFHIFFFTFHLFAKIMRKDSCHFRCCAFHPLQFLRSFKRKLSQHSNSFLCMFFCQISNYSCPNYGPLKHPIYLFKFIYNDKNISKCIEISVYTCILLFIY